MSKEYELQNITLTGLVKWLNKNKTKSTNKPFTTGDVQQYVDKVGHIPEYLGGNVLEKNKKGEFETQTYNLLKDK
jgi:hypothetical protein